MHIRLSFLYLTTLLAAGIILTSCFSSRPPAPNREITLARDGRKIEERITRTLSRRPRKIFHVYKDSISNYIKHGPYTEYYLTGSVKYEAYYNSDKLDSLSVFWYPNGHKQGEIQYQDGLLHGLAQTWHKNGLLHTEKVWSHGKLNGKEVLRDDNGRLIKEIIWKDNKIISKKIWDKKGGLSNK